MFCPFAVKSNCVAASRTWPMLPRSRLHLQREHRLNRVHDEERGLQPGGLFENPLEAGLGHQVDGCLPDAQPFTPAL